MTPLEYYNKLVQCAKDGSFPAVNEVSSCMYRTSDGRGCAVGILIPDSQYKHSFENQTVLALPDDLINSILPKGLTEQDLNSTQKCHDMMIDQIDFTKGFIKAINNLAWVNKFIPESKVEHV